MAQQLTTRWIRLQREAAQAAQQTEHDAVVPFSNDAQEKTKSNNNSKNASAIDNTVAEHVYSAWKDFFENFRDDEKEFERPHYLAAAIVVTDRLSQLGEKHGLDQQTLRLMTKLLCQFYNARFRDFDERISELMSNCQQLRAQLDVSELSKCYQEDELNSCQHLIRKELDRLGIKVPSSDEVSRPSQELRNLLAALGRDATTRTIHNPQLSIPPSSPSPNLPESTLDGIDINKRDSLDWTQLHSAAFVGKLELVSLLLEKGADVNAHAKDGMTPLHLAAKRGHVAVAKLLFAKGANLSAKDNDGNTAVHVASELYTPDMLVALIGMGAMLNQPNTAGWTPLHLAANKGKQTMLACLLDAGADINCKASNGWTPLAVSANCGHLQLTSYLRSKGGIQ